MEPEAFRRVEELFQRALELDESQRAEFLARSCGGDPALRREVESLFAQEQKSRVVQIEPIGPLAYLGLAHAHALAGDSTKAKAAYQNFLTLWKDADTDIPILNQAKAEYAKLQ